VPVVTLSQIPAGYSDLLERPLFAHVAVVAKDGTPRSYPMWFLCQDGDLSFTNTTGRPQTRTLRRTPHFAMSILDPDQPYRYLGLAATVRAIVPDPDGVFFYRLADRYGVEVTLTDPRDRVIITARPTGYWHQ
jgi:PPOX class probable F420-dependent enzyme